MAQVIYHFRQPEVLWLVDITYDTFHDEDPPPPSNAAYSFHFGQ